MDDVIVQTIRKRTKDNIDSGIIYYTMLFSLNPSLHLAKKHIELIAYINNRGTISTPGARDEFCERFNTTVATISNMVSTLTKKKVLIKEFRKTKLTPALRIDFNKDIVVRLYINKDEQSNTDKKET